MSGQTPSKNETDVSPKSSWEIISESENSRSNSIENISLNEYEEVVEEKPVDEQKTESLCIDIPEKNPVIIEDEACINIKMPSNTKCNKKPNEKTSKSDFKKSYNKLTKKKKVQDAFTAISLAASILALTGITLLCCLLPNQEDQKPLEKIQIDYIELIKGNTKNIYETINNTADLIQKINKDNFKSNNSEKIFEGQCFSDDEVCVANSSESFLNFNGQEFSKNETTDRLNNDGLIYDQYTLEDIKSTTSSLISSLKGICTNPSLHVFLCTLMQDICLIRLVNQLEKKQSLYEKLNQPAAAKHQKKTKSSEKLIKKQPKNKSQLEKNKTQIKTKSAEIVKPLSMKTSFKVTSSAPQMKSNNVTLEMPPKTENKISKFLPTVDKKASVDSSEKAMNENGKSECERRFEELGNKWKMVGKNHLLKMQGIKEKYRTELNQIRNNEKEVKRRQKVKLLTESYIQKLKSDREKYLMQVRKIKDEREKTLKRICKMKKSENNAKDLAIGNFVLSQNNSKAKLFNLQLNNDSKMQVKKKLSPINVPYDEYANFWKNLEKQIPNNDDSKQNLKKKALRKTKNNINIQETDTPRQIDKKTEISLIEEIVKKVMYNLTELRIKNESIVLSKPKKNKSLRKPKQHRHADHIENETLISKYAPTKSSFVPIEVPNLTLKIESHNFTKSNQILKSNVSLKSTDSQSTYHLAPLLYPNNSTFQLIDAESLTGVPLSKSPSSDISFEDFVSDNVGIVPFGPLAENFSFTTIAQRKPPKKASRKNLNLTTLGNIVPFNNSKIDDVPPPKPFNQSFLYDFEVDRTPHNPYNKTFYNDSKMDRAMPPLKSNNKNIFDDSKKDRVVITPLEPYNKNLFNKSGTMDKVIPFTWSGNESYSFIPVTPNSSFNFSDKQEEGEDLPLLDDTEFPVLRSKPKENFLFSNTSNTKPLPLMPRKNNGKNRIHRTTLEITPITSGTVTSFKSTYTVNDNQEIKLGKTNETNGKERYKDILTPIPKYKDGTNGNIQKKNELQRIVHSTPHKRDTYNFALNKEGEKFKKEEILPSHLVVKGNKTTAEGKNGTSRSSIETVPTTSEEDTSINSTYNVKNKLNEVTTEEIFEKMLQHKPKNKEDIDNNSQKNNKLQLVVRSKPPKQDIYNLVFDEAGDKIKKEETSQKHLPKYSPTVPHLSKQTPKLPKKVYLFKGRL